MQVSCIRHGLIGSSGSPPDSATVTEHSQVLVSVIIITKNRCNDLNRCLASLFDQTMKNFEVIVVDGGSGDDTLKTVKNYSVSLYIDETKDLAFVRNFGANEAKGEILAFLDDDAQADNSWLERAVSTLREKPFLAAVGGPTIIVGKQHMLGMYADSKASVFLSVFRKIYETVVTENKLFEICKFFKSGAFSIGSSLEWSSKIKGLVEVDYLSSCNFAIRREAFFDSGGFDSAFPITHHDTDFFFRIRKKGLKYIFNPAMIVFHHVNQNANTRPNSIELASDFALFYCRHCNAKSLTSLLRLMVNICMLNAFSVYQATKTGKVKWLYWSAGFLQGFKRFFKANAERTNNKGD